MKNYRQSLHFASPARTTAVRCLREALPADPRVGATRRILITVLALGCLGVGAAVLPGHADPHHALGSTQPTASASLFGPRYFIGGAWMY
jgi:hypothetical protein